MKSLRILQVFVVTFLVLSVLGSVAFAMDEAMYLAIREDLATNTKTLSRNLVLFHRFHNPGLPQMEPNDKYWKTSVVGHRGPEFFTNQYSVDYFGPGTYAVVDPTGSFTYGNVLVEIEAQAGTNFLDTRSGTSDTEDGIKIRKSTYDSMTQVCPKFKRKNASPYFKGKTEWISAKKTDLYTSPTCQAMFNRAFHELKIQFLIYDWYTNDTNKTYPPCNANAALAFVVMGALQADGTASYDSFSVRGYTPEFQFPNMSQTDKAAAIQNPTSTLGRYLYIEEMSILSDPKKRGHDTWSGLEGFVNPKGSPATLEKMKTTRFRCEKNKFPEDKSPIFKNKAS